MAVVIASAYLNDGDFLKAFEKCEFPASAFHHGDHLRLAWIMLHQHPFAEALERVRTGLQCYAAHNGVAQIYHETVTAAWVRLLATHDETTFDEFIKKNEHKLNPELLHRFWTPAALSSDSAKLVWMPPDREALPK